WNNLWFCGWWLAMAILVSFVASGAVRNYDEGLYYIQFMEWHQQWAIVPGLGNLYGRLAFNSNWHLFSTLFYANQPLVLYLNETTSFFVLIWLGFTGSQLLEISKPEKFSQKLFGTLGMAVVLPLPFITALQVSAMSSCSPDLVVIGLVYYCFYLIKGNPSESEWWLLAVLPVYLITVKMSSLPCLVFTCYGLWKLYGSSSYRILGWAIVASFLLGGVWLLRNYILSGYLVYPLAGVDVFHPDWKIPLENVLTEARWITNFAKRIPLENEIHDLTWVSLWWEGLTVSMKSLIGFSMVSILVGVYGSIRSRDSNNLGIYVIGLLGIFFWFIAAPDPRFGFGFIWAVSMNFLTQWISYFSRNRLIMDGKWIIRCVWFLTGIVLLLSVWPKEAMGFRRCVWTQPLHYLPPNTPKDSVNGIQIYAPIYWDQCLDSPIPCTPYLVYSQSFVFDLEARGKSFQDGFRQKLSQKRKE
ncbi:MAG: hypothetical protein K2Q22_16205, partial [Cytophagales bacterium]|nr:hypothetical protein [Cytophagales bacterium]